MKIHPDGTLEGTAEELAAYQSKVEANKMPLLHGHKPTGHKSMIGTLNSAGTRDSLISQLDCFTGVETIELAPSAYFNLIMSDGLDFGGSNFIKGEGRTTIIIVKR